MHHDPSSGEGQRSSPSSSYQTGLVYGAFGLFLLVGLYFSLLHSFLLFHNLSEILSIVVAFSISIIFWNARHLIRNTYISVVGISFGFIALVDLLHTLSYKGMNVFVGYGADLPTQFWIAGRYMQALAFLAAPLLIRKRVSDNAIFAICLGVTTGLIVSILSGVFPTCYVEGQGLTAFKIWSEYAICAMLAAAAWLLASRRAHMPLQIMHWLLAALVLNIFSELAFTSYIGVYDYANALGHILKIGSSLLIYKALVEASLRSPYQVLFQGLAESEQRYRQLIEVLPAAMCSCDHKGVITFYNEQAAKLWGEAPDDKERLDLFARVLRVQRLDGTPLSPEQSPMARCLREGLSFRNEELVIERMDGAQVFISSNVDPLRDVDGNIRGAINVFTDITERKLTEKRAENLARFPRENPYPVMRIASEGTVLYANPPSTVLLEYWSVEVGKAVPSDILGQVELALSSGEVLSREEKISQRTYAMSFAPVPSEGYVNVYGMDISERKEAEEALLLSRADLNLAQAVAHVGSWRLDARQNTLEWSDETYRIFGVPHGTPLDYEAFLELVHPGDRELVDERWQAASQTGSYEVEHRIVLDGEVKWVRELATLEFDDSGDLLSSFGIVQDITGLKNNELQLARLANEQSELAETARRLSMADSLKGITSVVRQTARKLAKADGASFVLLEDDMCHYVDEDAIEPLWKGERFPKERCISGWVMTNKQPAVIDDIYADPRIAIELYKPTFVQSLVMVPVRPEAPMAAIGVYWAERGSPEAGTVQVIQSVADLASVAMENVNLYEKLRQRTLMYKEQKELADAANSAKSEFLANMSHEIRTPLTGMLGMTDLLMDSLTDEKSRGYAHHLKRAGKSLRSIIDDILDLSKIEAGKMELDTMPVELGTSIEQCLSLYEPLAREKNLQWSIEIAPEVPEYALVDEAKLHQVLRNLASNAIKFTEKGAVAVTVGYNHDNGDDSGGRLQVDVRDTGIGIPRNRRNELFQNFGQLDSSYRKMHGGTGLGLAISKRLAVLMGGDIHLESEIDEGSVFTVTIPAPKTDEPDQNEPNLYEASGCQSLRLLVAEDNPVNQYLVRELLQRAGCEFVVAENGETVLKYLETDEQSYDLVLMDINMPGMDGVQTTRHIRESGAPYADIPIVALTAYAMPEERRRFLDAGMDGYLAKPFTVQQLFNVISELPEGRIARGRFAGAAPNAERVHGETAQEEAEELPAPLLDEAHLEETFDGNMKDLTELLHMLETDYSRQLGDMRRLVQERKFEETADMAHSFASGFGAVGMRRVAQESLRLEQMLRARELGNAVIVLAGLHDAIEKSFSALKEWTH